MHARKHCIAIDSLNFEFSTTPFDTVDEARHITLFLTRPLEKNIVSFHKQVTAH